MKRIFSPRFAKLSALVLSGILSTTALAADGGPTTAPSAATPATVQPTASGSPRVEVFAFTPVNKADPADWIGRGIQENLQSDIARTGATLVLPPHQATATEEPIDAARRDHADIAVVGTYQIVGDQVRVNAHLLDVASNTAAGGFSATGAQHDLFQIEDALGEQMRKLLPRPAAPAIAQSAEPARPTPSVPYAQPAPTVVYQEAPQTVYAPPTYYTPAPEYYPDYSYPYYSGYYGYPFGFYGGFRGGIGIYSGGYRGGYYRSVDRGGFRGSVSGGFHSGVVVHSGGVGHSGGGVHVGGGTHVGGGGHAGGGHR